MTSIEQQLRDAFTAAGQTMAEMPPMKRPAHTRLRRAWMVPVAVGSAVAAIVAGMAVLSGRTHSATTSVTHSQSPFSPGPALRPTGPPRFIVAAATAIVHDDFPAPGWKTVPPTYTVEKPVVLDAQTGRLLFTIPMPAGWWSSWHQVAAAPDDRTFVLSAVVSPPDPRDTGQRSPIRLFTVHLDENGRPGTPVAIPDFSTDEGQGIALSPDGRRVIYAPGILNGSTLTLVDVATGRRRAWTQSGTGRISDISWMPNGRDVAVLLNMPGSRAVVKILDTTKPGPSYPAHTRTIRIPDANNMTMVESVQVTPDGKYLITAVTHNSPVSPSASWTELVQIPVTGGPSRAITRIPESADGVSSGGFVLDGTGHSLLFSNGWNIKRVDLPTGKITTFTVPMGQRQGKGDSPGFTW